MEAEAARRAAEEEAEQAEDSEETEENEKDENGLLTGTKRQELQGGGYVILFYEKDILVKSVFYDDKDAITGTLTYDHEYNADRYIIVDSEGKVVSVGDISQ